MENMLERFFFAASNPFELNKITYFAALAAVTAVAFQAPGEWNKLCFSREKDFLWMKNVVIEI